MFEGEYLVHLDALNPDNPEQRVAIKLLVDHRDVADIQGTPERHKPASALLRVEVGNKAKGLVRIVLPQPAVPVGESVFMAADDVKQRAG
jgi:hypothetical protein